MIGKDENHYDRIYAVEFFKYSNYSKTSVIITTDDYKTPNIDNFNHIDVGDDGGPILIKEKDLEYFKKYYGGGIKCITFVGTLVTYVASTDLSAPDDGEYITEAKDE